MKPELFTKCYVTYINNLVCMCACSVAVGLGLWVERIEEDVPGFEALVLLQHTVVLAQLHAHTSTLIAQPGSLV